jgi:nitroreductase
MDVYQAVTSRRAVRGFTDEPVSREVLERVLSAAAWSPSGSNLQPWNSYVLTGPLLAELKTRAVERVAHGDPWDEREYEMYPRVLKSPYGERRSAFGRSATAHSALRVRTGRRASGRPSPTGTVSAHPPPCSATSTATWAGPNGPTSGCICRPSCCYSAPKGCTVARRWRGRRFARRSRRSCHPRTG